MTRAMTGNAMAWLLGASAAIALAAPANAQDATGEPAAQPEAGADEAVVPAEIVVTARRRAESLQDVPIAISTFDDEMLADLQADTIAGIQYATPNLYLDQGDAGNAVIYIRGVGQNDSLAFADAGVGVYVDDVFIARSQAAFLEMFDVERIEVLRGPQGTLYGRNTIGGAIKFVSTRPTRFFSGQAEVGVGNYGMTTARGRVSGPIAGETLRGKLALAYTSRDGYAENAFDGEDDGDHDTFAGRASLLFTPDDRVEFLLSGDFKIDRPDTSRSPVRETAIVGFDGAGLVTFEPGSDPYVVDVNANGLNDQTGHGLSLTSRFKANDTLTVESITAWRNFDFDLNLDTDGTELPILDILVLQEQDQFSQELRVTHSVPDGLSVTAGGYYFHDDDTTFSGVDNKAATFFGFPVTAFGFPTSSLAETKQETDSYALFADATLPLGERLDVSVGARYTWETRTASREFEFFFDPSVSVIENTPDFLAGEGFPGQIISGEASFEAFTPRASLSFDLDDDTMLYLSASRGFKSGGFDGRANSEFGFRPFRPEYVWSYEAGAKTSWLDGRMLLNAAFFYNDYTDVQVTSFGADPVTGTFVSLFTNAASARAYGAELDLLARPSRSLTITGSLGLLDAAYREFDILVAGVVTDVSDRRPVNAPDFNASLGVTWERPVSDKLMLTLHGDAAYRSEIATEITDSPFLRQPGYERVNAFVALGDRDERWELRAGVQNLTDEAVRVQAFNLSDFPGVQLGFYGAPRTYDLRFITRF